MILEPIEFIGKLIALIPRPRVNLSREGQRNVWMLSKISLSKGHKPSYQRHQPEHTLLYQIVERYWPEFRDLIEAQGSL